MAGRAPIGSGLTWADMSATSKILGRSPSALSSSVRSWMRASAKDGVPGGLGLNTSMAPSIEPSPDSLPSWPIGATASRRGRKILASSCRACMASSGPRAAKIAVKASFCSTRVEPTPRPDEKFSPRRANSWASSRFRCTGSSVPTRVGSTPCGSPKVNVGAPTGGPLGRVAPGVVAVLPAIMRSKILGSVVIP